MIDTTYIQNLKKKANCEECLLHDYCQRIPVNDIIVNAIKKTGKCPDFILYSKPYDYQGLRIRTCTWNRRALAKGGK